MTGALFDDGRDGLAEALQAEAARAHAGSVWGPVEDEVEEETSPFAELGMRERGGAGLPAARAAELLGTGDLEILGRIVSSNETFLVEASDGADTVWAVYKPVLGERPLGDFPPGLHRRERAAFLLSEHLGWGLVPLTVLREDAPFGPGSLQRFVVGDDRRHYFLLVGESDAMDAQLRRLALLDVVMANADRKAGHVLLGDDGLVRGIDHGLCFHEQFKLRTVIWDFAGESIPEDDLAAIAGLIDDVPAGVAELLTGPEARALAARARGVLAAGRLPVDRSGMRFPWPLV